MTVKLIIRLISNGMGSTGLYPLKMKEKLYYKGQYERFKRWCKHSIVTN